MYTINIIGKKTSQTITLIMFRLSTGQKKVDFVEVQVRKQMDWLPDDIFHQEKAKYKVIDISSGISLPGAFWDGKKKLCTGSYTYINRDIAELKDQVQQFIDSNPKLSPEELKKAVKVHVIDHFHNPEVRAEKIFKESIPTVLSEYIKFKCIEWGKGANPKKKATVRNYNKFLNWLLKFETTTNSKLDLKTLTDSQVKKFIEWMANQTKEDGSKFKVNYLNFFRKTIKTLVNEATNEDDMVVKVNLKKKVFKKIMEQPDDVYLTVEHLDLIKEAKYKATDVDIKRTGLSASTFERIKDLAIISSACGYRWSDLYTIDKATFIKDEKTAQWYFLLNKSTKTSNRVIIPCFDSDVLNIIKKYNWEVPKMAEQTFNEGIKIVCKLAGLTSLKKQQYKDPVTLDIITEDKLFYEIVSHRTFRKTFASNLIRQYNIPLVIAMSYTGHKTESSFRHYIRLTPEEYYAIGAKAMQSSYLKVV